MSAAFRREVGVLLFYAALTVFATRPLASSLRDATLYGVDPAIYVWTVNWVSGHLLDPPALLEGNVYHPTRHVAVLSDLAFGSALLVAPLRPILRDPVVLYNVGVLLTLTFGAWAFYTLVRELTGSTAAGLLSGILAAFGSHQLFHIYQLALINIAWLALFLLALHRTFERPGLRNSLFLAASFALTVLSSAYFGVAGAVMALLWAGLHIRRLSGRAVLIASAGAALVAALCLLPYARAFLWLQATEGVRRSVEVNVDNAFKPARDITSGAYLYRGLLGQGGERLFPGLVSILLAGWACVRRVKGWAFYAASAVVLVLLSLGPVIQVGSERVSLPYAALFAIPPFDALMHPYSFAAVARLNVCVLAGLGFAALGRSPWLILAGLAAAMTDVLAPPAGLRPVPAGVPEVYRALDALPAGPVLEIPLELPEALIWAARHGRPVLNGAGALAPVDHDRLQQWIHRDWLRPAREGHVPAVDDSRAMRQLLQMPARYVIIRAGEYPELAAVREAFDRSRRFTRVAGTPGGDAVYGRVEAVP
jgi:hypothetical protein